MTTIHTILCPVDFSPGSERALEQAAYLAERTGAGLELLHVYQIPVLNLPEGQITTTAERVAEMLNDVQDALDHLKIPLLTRGLNVKTKIISGEPTEAILRHAQDCDASLLVLGTHGRTGLQRLMLGSTAEHVVRRAALPVLTVRNAA